MVMGNGFQQWATSPQIFFLCFRNESEYFVRVRVYVFTKIVADSIMTS